jgi:uncharacterized protein
MRVGLGAAALIGLLLCGCRALHAGYSVSGKVVAYGGAAADMAGYVVSLADSGLGELSTGADGAFEFKSVPAGAYRLVAAKAGKVFSFSYTASSGARDSPEIDLYGGDIDDLVVTAVDADKITIAMIQGSGPRSPIEGQKVENVRGVITKVTRQHQNGTYTVTQTDGEIMPQWIDADGFFMEALVPDGDPATSDGIFVCTHNPNFEEPKLLDSVPTDLAVGQVVTVSGTVAEVIPVNRFGESEGYLSITRIVEPTVLRMASGGAAITQTPPDGVLLTYDEAPAGLTAEQFRTLPWEDDSLAALGKAIKAFESVEGMTVKVDAPVVTGSTYYNITPILADGGLKGGAPNKDRTAYGGMVLKENDFNAELLFCDYAPPSWKTFVALPQTGDALKNTAGLAQLRGVMDYTIDGIYWISPLDSQGYGFTPVTGRNDKTRTSSTDAYKPWRIGKGANAQFVASWPILARGNVTDQNLSVASYNIENYCLEEDSYEKYADIADILLYNLRAPDVVTVIEMGDDRGSTIVYENQGNSYAVPDGVVWATKNFRAIIDSIKAKSSADALSFGTGGIDYDFREIAPEENSDGGEPGTNIRVGFLFRKDRVEFVKQGIKVNNYDDTAGDASTWPVPGDVGGNPRLLELARNNVAIAGVQGQDGVVRPHLTQSPGRINASAFRGSRKPLVGEFRFTPTGKTFFVIGNHFGSKGGDAPLYGFQQPPTFSSEPKRTQQAKAVNDFVRAILGIDPRAKVIVTGDMNDFQFTIALKTLSGADRGSASRILFAPAEELLPANQRYSYLFRGNSQEIDHIYASKALFDNLDTGSSGANAVFIPHIDSIFCQNNHIETSDHDPIVCRFNLGGL